MPDPLNPMKSIRVKLTLAFILVSLIGTLLVVSTMLLEIRSAFDRFIMNQYQQTVSQEMEAYYQAHGNSWEGIAAQMPAILELSSSEPGVDLDSSNITISYTIIDTNHKVILSTSGVPVGKYIPIFTFGSAIPLELDGKPIGWVSLTFFSKNATANSAVEAFVRGFQHTILISALGAVVIAVILAVILAYTMTRTLHELTDATEEIARGQLGRQVKIRSKDEFGKLAASFNKMSADVARANEAQRRMTADIAHDLRTPLSVISGYAETLADQSMEATPEVFATIYEETQHLSRLVEDLRILSLADAGELPLYLEPVDLGAFLHRAAMRHAINAEQRGVKINVDVKGELPPINLDPERFSQIYDNLIANALRYIPSGGEILLAAERIHQQVKLTVHDNGQGISPEDLPFVFNRLYRGDPARLQNGESGLGLAIVKSLVEANGGAVQVESIPGRETTFTILLPLAQAGEGE